MNFSQLENKIFTFSKWKSGYLVTHYPAEFTNSLKSILHWGKDLLTRPAASSFGHVLDLTWLKWLSYRSVTDNTVLLWLETVYPNFDQVQHIKYLPLCVTDHLVSQVRILDNKQNQSFPRHKMSLDSLRALLQMRALVLKCIINYISNFMLFNVV